MERLYLRFCGFSEPHCSYTGHVVKKFDVVFRLKLPIFRDQIWVEEHYGGEAEVSHLQKHVKCLIPIAISVVLISSACSDRKPRQIPELHSENFHLYRL